MFGALENEIDIETGNDMTIEAWCLDAIFKCKNPLGTHLESNYIQGLDRTDCSFCNNLFQNLKTHALCLHPLKTIFSTS